MQKLFSIIFSLSIVSHLPADDPDTFYLDSNNKNFSFVEDTAKGIVDGNRQTPIKVVSTPQQIEFSQKIKYLIVIFQENWSYDSLYGKIPGSNGLANATAESTQQVDLNGKPYAKQLTCIDTRTGHPYPHIPQDLPNGPFDLQPYVPIDKITGDAWHRFYQEQFQINGGLMNRFALFSDAGGFAMSYYDASSTAMGTLAKEYVLCDNWFHSCYGGSTCAAIWLFAAQMPTWPNASKDIVARLLPSGILLKDGLVSPDGYAINDAEPYYSPYKSGIPINRRMPPQNYKTIGDALSEKNISWKWYAEGWNNALAGRPDITFPYHHQAPVYFSQYAPGTELRKKHLADLDDFYLDLERSDAPAVSFIRSLDRFSEHPEDGPLIDGLNWCANLIRKIQNSSIWNECAIIVTYDENGGRWDHVSPPVVDRFGPGTRVPAMIISPFAKRGYVDHTFYETVSILKFIEERWGLQALSTRDNAANNFLNAFDENHLQVKGD